MNYEINLSTVRPRTFQHHPALEQRVQLTKIHKGDMWHGYDELLNKPGKLERRGLVVYFVSEKPISLKVQGSNSSQSEFVLMHFDCSTLD